MKVMCCDVSRNIQEVSRKSLRNFPGKKGCKGYKEEVSKSAQDLSKCVAEVLNFQLIELLTQLKIKQSQIFCNTHYILPVPL